MNSKIFSSIFCGILIIFSLFTNTYAAKNIKQDDRPVMGVLTSFANTSAKGVNQDDRPVIGILTSGGDCSGLNSIIYAVYKRATALGYKVIGFRHGVHGMIQDDYIVLNDEICTPDLLKRAGTILKANTKELKDKAGKPISKEQGDKLIIEEYKKLGLKGLIYIGGDGSIGVMKNLVKKDPSLNIIAVPKTIDNDIANTDVAVGFSTVARVATEEIENIISTAQSHSRIFVVEVMGRAAGYIALQAGLAVGADAIIIPEIKFDMKKLIAKMQEIQKSGKDYGIIVVSEGVEPSGFQYKINKISDVLSRKNYGGVSSYIEKELKKAGFDVRAVKLGHTQRGGKTSEWDRILAQIFGVSAVNLIDKQDGGHLLGVSGNKVIKTRLSDIQTTTRKLDVEDPNIQLAKDLGIYVGE